MLPVITLYFDISVFLLFPYLSSKKKKKQQQHLSKYSSTNWEYTVQLSSLFLSVLLARSGSGGSGGRQWEHEVWDWSLLLLWSHGVNYVILGWVHVFLHVACIFHCASNNRCFLSRSTGLVKATLCKIVEFCPLWCDAHFVHCERYSHGCVPNYIIHTQLGTQPMYPTEWSTSFHFSFRLLAIM